MQIPRNSSVSMDEYISLIFGLFITLLVLYRRQIYIILKTLPRDLRMLCRLGNTLVTLLKYSVMKETLISLFKKTLAKDPNRVIIYFKNTTWTVQELDSYSNKIARIFQDMGYKKGDVVALMSYNSPEYIGIWLGLGKLGVVTALINSNLRSQSLAHCVNVANCKGFIFSREFASDVKEIQDDLMSHLEYFVVGGCDGNGGMGSKMKRYTDLDKLMESVSADAVKPASPIRPNDCMFYFYTSGTTGLPKASAMAHNKLVMLAAAIKHAMKVSSDDVIYNVLPMYHLSGGLLGILPALVFGSPVVIKVKFSASNFFADCVKYKCTVSIYIGEMCRYLLSVPPSPNDTQHSLRAMIGSGMRPSVWQEFVDRFKIPVILEAYGSTEGISATMNIDNTVGAIGFVLKLVPASINLIVLIKYDEAKNEPIRDENGLCIKCRAGETGMCVGMIWKKVPMKNFGGYVGQTNTKEKIVKDVFKHGDSAYVSGDMLYMDQFGYLYFKDRIGDTFRWKGENVSTSEVEAAIQKLIGNKECAVYGVQVGNFEGRAGMVTIVDRENEINLEALAAGIDQNLPPYARPLFLRISQRLELTGTFKVKKVDLKNDSFDPSKTDDALYFKHSTKGYTPIDKNLHEDIVTGVIKF